VVPFAGPPCFLDPGLRDNNRHIADPGIFPSVDAAVGWLSERLPSQRVARWLPGDRYEVRAARLTPDPRWEGFSFDPAVLEGWLDGYAAERAGELAAVYREFGEPADDGGLGERFADHFARLGELSPYFLERISMTVRFQVQGPGGGRWDVQLGPDKVRVDLTGGARPGEVQYRFEVGSRWLAAVIDGRIGWEDLLLSLRFSAWRSPDVYNDYLVGLLKHADASALAAVQRYETSRDDTETITVQTPGGASYRVGRWCPHAGEDLAVGGVIQDGTQDGTQDGIQGGVLRCLGHNFDFDLETGTCRNARCQPLQTTPLQPAAAGTITKQEVEE
jgi:nitrite reductase/ring-hydroxylating ferredoxin subunit